MKTIAATTASVRRWRPDRVTLIVLAIAIAAAAMRLWHLGDRAMHHDESLHAIYSWYLVEGRGYQHNPLTHGPLQFHLIAAVFFILGDSDATARVPAALFGSGLVLLPLLLRRWLGGPGAVIAACALAVSPALLYYSRFARNDILMAVFTTTAITAVWRYRSEGRERWLITLAAMLALQFAAKETAYIFAAVLLLYLNSALAHALFWQPRQGRPVPPREWVTGLVLLSPTAWLIAAFWDPLARLRERMGWHDRPREADLLVVAGTLVAPLLAPLLLLPFDGLAGATANADVAWRVRVASVGLLAIAAAWVGTSWRQRTWLIAAGVFLAITIPLYATFGTNPRGVWGLPWTSLQYWIEQHGVRRGEQPLHYYAMLTPYYEALVLLPALATAAWGIVRRDALALLLGWWFLGTFVALSLAGEKMPWLVVNLVPPLALLAAYGLGRAVTSLARSVREGGAPPGRIVPAMGGALIMLALLAFTAVEDVRLNVDHPDTPREPLIYVQTSAEVPRLARTIIDDLHAGRATGIFVDNTDSVTWPWAWYFRREPAQYADALFFQQGGAPTTAIRIVSRGTLATMQVEPGRGPTEVYIHRWWFPEEGYRALTPESFRRGLLDGSLPRRWVRFARQLIPVEAIGVLEGAVIRPGTG